MDVDAMEVGRITDPAFLNFGRYYFPEKSRLIPITLVYIVILYGASALFLNHTSFGRQIYAVGSNEATARLAGINVKRVKFVCFIIAGMLSAFGGLVLVAQLGLGEAYTGQNMILEVVTAVVLGGVLLTGGKGRLTGVIIAVLILGVIRNGMVHLEQVSDISVYWRDVAKGVVLLLAIGLYSFRKSFNAKRLRTRQ
jgi:ribose transport system permease protein